MKSLRPLRPVSELSATIWKSRCIARIRAIDLTVSMIEADALAHALWDSPGCKSDLPEASAERLFALNASTGLT